MRIYTWLTMNLRNGGAIYHAEDYDGPVALAGGGGTEVTNETVPTGPYGPQIPYILGLFQEAANLYNQGAPQAYGTNDGAALTPDINGNLSSTQDTVGGVGFANVGQNNLIQQFLQQLAGQTNPGAELGQSLAGGIESGIGAQLGAGDNALTDLGQGQVSNAEGALGTVFGQQPGGPIATGTQGGQTDASGALSTLLGGPGSQNPYLESLVQSAMQGQYDSFDRNILPGIRGEAQQAGQIGGTRQGIAEGIAGSDLANRERLVREGIYGNAFNSQIGAQGNALSNVLNAQQGDQGAALQAEQIGNQDYQQYIQSLLQGTQQAGGFLGQGLGLGYDAIGSGTAQAGNIFNAGNTMQLNQTMQALGMIPGFQAQSMGQLGGINQMGLQQYGLDQNAINALMDQYYFNQNSPFNLLSQYQQYVTGPYGGTVYPFNPTGGGIPIGDNAGYGGWNPWGLPPNGYGGGFGAPPGGYPGLTPPGPVQPTAPPIMGQPPVGQTPQGFIPNESGGQINPYAGILPGGAQFEQATGGPTPAPDFGTPQQTTQPIAPQVQNSTPFPTRTTSPMLQIQ